MATETESVNCTICQRPLTLLQPETCTDDKGKAVHSDCYVKILAPDKPQSPTLAA